MPVEVFLLGGWDIRVDGKSVFLGGRRSQKCLELLKYFMGNRGKKLSPESIVDNLWGDSNLVDSLNTLRTQIFRLRRVLQEEGLYGKEAESPFGLIFENGFYIFSVREDCVVDTDLFEKFEKEAETQQQENAGTAIENYKKAVQCYKGEYLPENADSTWTFPQRIRFRRLYVQALLRMFGLLKKQGRNTEIVESFEQAMGVEPLEESLNLCYLEALLELKEYGLALSHYRYVTERMTRELFVKPSAAMKDIYIRITAGEQNFRKAELWDLSRRFPESNEFAGALCCDLDYFRMICDLEKRRSKRSGCRAFLGLVTISDSAGLLQENLEAAGKKLKSILQECLREGDVVTQWNPHQILFLLTDSEPEGLIPVGSRIRKTFKNSAGCGSIKIDLEFQPVQGTPTKFLNKICK